MKPQDNLYRVLEKYRNIETYLEDSEGEITEEMLTELEILDSNKDEAIANVFYMLMEKDDELELLKSRIESLSELKGKKQKTADSLNKLLTFALKMFGDMKIDEFNLSLTPSVSVNAEGLQTELNDIIIPEKTIQGIEKAVDKDLNLDPRFYRVKVKVEPNKVTIKEALKDNSTQIEGCELITKYNLKVK